MPATRFPPRCTEAFTLERLMACDVHRLTDRRGRARALVEQQLANTARADDEITNLDTLERVP